jgi:7-keto-8-aminopelargonate synthetase-like enzyme
MEKMVELKRRYKLRLFIDESISFGILGEHGRGITEHCNISVSLSISTEQPKGILSVLRPFNYRWATLIS